MKWGNRPEGPCGAKGGTGVTEPLEGTMGETSGSRTVSTKLQRIAELAKNAPEMAFTTLAHHIDVDWLREAYERTRKDGATGVDGQTASEYATNLEENLRSLLERAKSGAYRAPPVRRVSSWHRRTVMRRSPRPRRRRRRDRLLGAILHAPRAPR